MSFKWTKMVIISSLTISCGTDPTLREGFYCMKGSSEDCMMIEQAARAYDLCEVPLYRSEFYFFYEGDEECKRFEDNVCGVNLYGSAVYIDQCKLDVCNNLPKYIVHEPLHELWPGYNPHAVELIQEQNRILTECFF